MQQFRIIGNDGDRHCFEIGDIVKLEDDDGTDRKLYNDQHGTFQWVFDHDVELVDE